MCFSFLKSARAGKPPSVSGKIAQGDFRKAAFGLRLNAGFPVGFGMVSFPRSRLTADVRNRTAIEPADAQNLSDERSNGCWRIQSVNNLCLQDGASHG